MFPEAWAVYPRLCVPPESRAQSPGMHHPALDKHLTFLILDNSRQRTGYNSNDRLYNCDGIDLSLLVKLYSINIGPLRQLSTLIDITLVYLKEKVGCNYLSSDPPYSFMKVNEHAHGFFKHSKSYLSVWDSILLNWNQLNYREDT